MLGNEIDRRLKEIYVDFKKDKNDKTGWGLLQSLKKEANFHFFLFSFFIYRVFEIAYENGEIVNAVKPLEKLIDCCWHSEENSFIPREVGTPKKNEKEIFPGTIFKEEVLTKVLEILGLQETSMSFYHLLIVREEKLNETIYLGEKQIHEIKEKGKELVIKKFLKEYQKKNLGERSKIIKISRKYKNNSFS